MIHAVGGFGIGRRAVPDPLLAHQITQYSTRLHRICRGEAEDVAVQLFHAVGRSGVEGYVIDAEDVGTLRRGLSVRKNLEQDEGEGE